MKIKYYVNKRDINDKITETRIFDNPTTAKEFCITYKYSEVVTRDNNGYILNTIYTAPEYAR